MKTILSIDPGKVNMGYCVIQTNKDKYKIHEIGMIKNTISDLKDFNLKDTVHKYNNEIQDKINSFKITEVSMERFVSRGLLGSLSEYICIMQGILAINHDIKVFNLVTAATWKNSFNKNADLNQFYKDGKKLKVLPHEIDAFLIGLYFLGKNKFFKKFSSENHRTKILMRLSDDKIRL